MKKYLGGAIFMLLAILLCVQGRFGQGARTVVARVQHAGEASKAPSLEAGLPLLSPAATPVDDDNYQDENNKILDSLDGDAFAAGDTTVVIRDRGFTIHYNDGLTYSVTHLESVGPREWAGGNAPPDCGGGVLGFGNHQNLFKVSVDLSTLIFDYETDVYHRSSQSSSCENCEVVLHRE